MKKLFLLLLVFPFVLGSCSKDDDKQSLNGTTWEANENEDGYIYKSTVKFYESTYSGSGYEEYNGNKHEFSGTGTYTYDHPDVIFIEDGETYKGKISGNKMTVGEDNIVYIKK
ncbi:MAG: hypothetical protein KH100_15825 [Dysgonomonas mossii]|uniref:hypothetical protein n=1 Tax=Dysgonomonas mossii TaxID=163665 RepID=UPI001D5A2396|nr:hypothetical protein [Dysgonomonas mossii]MBS5798115.1 hypothetical protein [Dysgonomonas mossii]MBS7112652.1 hypothetical protein [Dysgonomonas mossii]